MKKVYAITINKTEEVEESVLEKDTEGKEIKITKKVEKKTPKTFFIKKPNRSLWDSAALFEAQKKSEYMRAGVISSVQLQKRHLNEDGILSETQKKEREDLYNTVFEKQIIYSDLNKKSEKDKTKEDKEKITNLLNEMVIAMQKIQQYDNFGQSIFDGTSEILAQNQTIRFWLLNLAYEETAPNQYEPLFGEGNYEEKLKKYDEIEEREDVFEYEVVKKLLLITSLYITGKCSTKEDFDVLLKLQEDNEKVDENKNDDKKEPSKENPPKVEEIVDVTKTQEIAPKIEEPAPQV